MILGDSDMNGLRTKKIYTTIHSSCTIQTITVNN